jgi:hypothetical protein
VAALDDLHAIFAAQSIDRLLEGLLVGGWATSGKEIDLKIGVTKFAASELHLLDAGAAGTEFTEELFGGSIQQ